MTRRSGAIYSSRWVFSLLAALPCEPYRKSRSRRIFPDSITAVRFFFYLRPKKTSRPTDREDRPRGARMPLVSLTLFAPACPVRETPRRFLGDKKRPARQRL